MFEGKEVVVFDLDGTLVDIALDWNVIRKSLLDSFPGTGITDLNSTTSMITERVAELFGHGQKRRAYRMVREFENGCGMTRIEGNIALARELKEKGKKLAIFSGNCHETIEECLRKAGIRDIFDFIIGKEDVERHKPHPEGLLKIMSHFGAPKENVAFMGNEDDDAEAGKSAGVNFVYVQM